MGDRVFTCHCGHKQKISEFQLGMETSCPQCRADIRFTLENTAPAGGAQTQPDSPPAGGPAKPEWRHVPEKDRCAKCGRVFRGDWDKYQTPAGMVCHICAHSAAEGSQTTLYQAGEVEPVMTIREERSDPLEAIAHEEEERRVTFFERYEKELRVALGAAAALVIFAGIYYAFVEPPPPPPAGPDPAMEMPSSVRWHPPRGLVWALRFVFSIAGIGMPIYVTLAAADQLPHDRFLPNLLNVALVSLFLAVVTFPLGLVCFGPPLAVLLQAYILWDRYDLRAHHIVLWLLVYLPCAVFLVILEQLVLGLIGRTIA